MYNDKSTLIKGLVTIAIPIYNAEEYLAFAIQSVINQTFKNWELLLMEDGSTDSSCAIAEEFAQKDSRIAVLKDGENKGLVYRLNQSIALARGELYARMDADDIMYVTRIKEQVEFMESHPEIDVCGTSIMTIDDNNNIIGSGYGNGRVTEFYHPTIMGKTAWFRSNPYADWAVRAEDTELWLRTMHKSNFYCIGRPLFFYREFGVTSFRKYMLTQKTMIKVGRRYKQYNKSFSWYLILAFKTYSKMIMSVILAVFCKLEVLVTMRKRAFIPGELQLTKEDLDYSIRL